MSLFKRRHAPLTDETWKRIDAVAADSLRTSLRGRRFVDVSEPKGWDYSALGLGRLEIAKNSPVEDVDYGMRLVKPLVETRVGCELDIWELDNLSRGATDVDLGPLEEAAGRAARFEDRALLLGLEEAGIEGLAQKAGHPPIELVHEPDGFLDAVSKATLDLRQATIDGPFALVVGSKTFLFLASASTGYPLLKRVSALVGGPVIESDLLEGGLLVSLRGNDFQLTLGQDFSVGYEHHDHRKIRLFIAESFTFQVNEPRAVLPLPRRSGTSTGGKSRGK